MSRLELRRTFHPGRGNRRGPGPRLQARAGVDPRDVRKFVADNLFEYMDGNAEGYIIYNFVSMAGVNCLAGGVTLTFDVSEMDSPESAYGIFMSNRDPRRPVEKLGTMGQIQPRRGVFVKDKYYVELAANPEGDHTKVIRAFLTAMEKRVPGSSDFPPC